MHNQCKGGKDLHVFPVCSGELRPDQRGNYSQPVEGEHILIRFIKGKSVELTEIIALLALVITYL